ncbi:hypothetical protein RJT34_03767 [Clitoria ternatea]|uniref:Uncharacterized protein n=1 Tax=Clitoria ternatea TaxID=43366 RepID=A0AAN9Q021_CLITE
MSVYGWIISVHLVTIDFEQYLQNQIMLQRNFQADSLAWIQRMKQKEQILLLRLSRVGTNVLQQQTYAIARLCSASKRDMRHMEIMTRVKRAREL